MTGLWVVNFFYMGIKRSKCGNMSLPYEYGPANSVAAAAVIRRILALKGVIGFKESEGGVLSQVCMFASQPYNRM